MHSFKGCCSLIWIWREDDRTNSDDRLTHKHRGTLQWNTQGSSFWYTYGMCVRKCVRKCVRVSEYTCTCCSCGSQSCSVMKGGSDRTSCNLTPSDLWSPEREEGSCLITSSPGAHVVCPARCVSVSYLFTSWRQFVRIGCQHSEVVDDSLEVGDLSQHGNLPVLQKKRKESWTINSGSLIIFHISWS